MDKCKYCGGEIIFRHGDNGVAPIHLSGYCSGSLNSSPSSYIPPFTYDSYVNPQAHCPYPDCRAPVFFYQSPYGGRVYFDELGPPWPKHPCTDTSLTRSNRRSITTGEKLTYHWQLAGWEPLIQCRTDENTGEEFASITGIIAKNNKNWKAYVARRELQINDTPVLIREICPTAGRFEIATIKLEHRNEVELIPIYTVGYTSCSHLKIRGSWKPNKKMLVLVEWFITAINLPLRPFTLNPRKRILDPIAWYDNLHEAILMGPSGPRAQDGSLLIDLHEMRSFMIRNA